MAAIAGLYDANKDIPTVKVKRELWETLLGVALGEIAGVDIDDLFVRHTYLTTIVGIITQAVFGLDIAERAATDPADLVHGTKFSETTGLTDVVESDFFSWIVEVDDSTDTIISISRHVAAYDWGQETPAAISSHLYQTVIPAGERKQLGEYYTPDWLASEIVAAAVTDPLNQRVLDPACGSGAFLTAAARHLIAAAEAAGLDAAATLTKMQQQVTGIDVHPVAVHLARAAWVMSAKDVINEGNVGTISVPVHLGDSLQLLYDTQSMFNRQEIVVPVADDSRNRELRFPRSLVDRADTFGAAMSAIAEAVHAGRDPHEALSRHDLDDSERALMSKTVNTLSDLHEEGRNHIWAYYTRNLVRPIAISSSKVDVLVGNPPWLTYNKTINALRQKLRALSKAHGIWAGGRYATHQDIAGLFFLRSMDLYLADAGDDSNGVCSMVLPHSALSAGQYAKWRTGKWGDTLSVNMAWQTPWDLEPLTPNTFFPVPACVVHAQRRSTATSLPAQVERCEGTPGLHKRTTATLPTGWPAVAIRTPRAARSQHRPTVHLLRRRIPIADRDLPIRHGTHEPAQGHPRQVAVERSVTTRSQEQHSRSEQRIRCTPRRDNRALRDSEAAESSAPHQRWRPSGHGHPPPRQRRPCHNSSNTQPELAPRTGQQTLAHHERHLGEAQDPQQQADITRSTRLPRGTDSPVRVAGRPQLAALPSRLRLSRSSDRRHRRDTGDGSRLQTLLDPMRDPRRGALLVGGDQQRRDPRHGRTAHVARPVRTP